MKERLAPTLLTLSLSFNFSISYRASSEVETWRITLLCGYKPCGLVPLTNGIVTTHLWFPLTMITDFFFFSFDI